jgi:hypothetical protein
LLLSMTISKRTSRLNSYFKGLAFSGEGTLRSRIILSMALYKAIEDKVAGIYADCRRSIEQYQRYREDVCCRESTARPRTTRKEA